MFHQNNCNDDNERSVEDVYTKAIGESGKWQIFVFMITTFPLKVVIPSVHFGIIFMAPKTTFRCLEREDAVGDLMNMTCYSDCKKYECISDIDDNIIKQWNLICDRAWLADLTQCICMSGTLFGSVSFGVLADKYGRRLALIFASTLEICSTFLTAVCPNLWTLTLVRFFGGISTGGTSMISFVLLMEIFGPMKRDLLGIVNRLPLTLGYFIMSATAYYFRSWRLVSLATAIPTLAYLTYFCCLPESPKWLISVGTLEEASVVMTSAAKWNKLPTDNMRSIVEIIANDLKVIEKTQRKATITDLVTLASLRIRTVCSCIIWFITGVTLYGNVQYFGQASSNIFLMLIFIGLVEVPGLLLGGYVSNIYGRRVAVIIFCIITSIANGFLALPDEWYYLKIISGCIGISCSGAVFAVVYVYTTELFQLWRGPWAWERRQWQIGLVRCWPL